MHLVFYLQTLKVVLFLEGKESFKIKISYKIKSPYKIKSYL